MKSIKTDWYAIEAAITDVLSDMVETSLERVKLHLEGWFEVLKRVMRLWKGEKSALATASKQTKREPGQPVSLLSSSGAPSSVGQGATNSDADDFYVYLHDEEDKSQTHFKKASGRGRGNLSMGSGSERVLGFWCFNAGVGFKSIKGLEPRSIILTSGTLSPLPSFEAELQVEFKQKLEGPHVIAADQVNIAIMRKSVNNHEFNFSY